MDGSTSHLFIQTIQDGWNDTGKYHPFFKSEIEAKEYIKAMDSWDQHRSEVVECELK